MTTPTIFPVLDGYTYEVEWEPNFFNMPTEKASSGAEIDVALAQYPLHDFKLKYSFLRNVFYGDPLTYGGPEFQAMMGFWLQNRGNFGRFLFENPNDYAVKGQLIATTSSSVTTYGPLVRTFGVAAYSGTEPIGYVNTTDADNPFHVYVDGVLQAPSSYTLNQATPVDQTVTLHSAPPSGKTLKVDMSYYYWCKIPADTQTFTQFMSNLFSIDGMTLRSCRQGA